MYKLNKYQLHFSSLIISTLLNGNNPFLPLIIRTKHQNIIKILFINSSNIDFNKIINKHLDNLKTLLKNVLIVESLPMSVSIFIHCLITDAPARAKITKTQQLLLKNSRSYYESFSRKYPSLC